MLLHDVSQTALAGAVLTLGLVILLEIRSFARLRRMVDINLGRVFEQLEMLRAESRQVLEAQAQAAARLAPVVIERQTLERPLAAPPALERPAVEPTALDFVVAPPIDTNAYQNATTLAAHGVKPEEIAARSGLPAGEARLLASLAAARARRDEAAQAAPSPVSGARS
ncbi:MAG TPA: hypothetical protein VHN17_15165 [Steroidobacteraceae bacterium]|jgi:hypothetical protein|nr:hypothetical protein [Steroidobacteraceae bacterium]